MTHYVLIPHNDQQPIIVTHEENEALDFLVHEPGNTMRWTGKLQGSPEINFMYVYNLANGVNYRAAALIQRCVGFTWAVTGPCVFFDPPTDQLASLLRETRLGLGT